MLSLLPNNVCYGLLLALEGTGTISRFKVRWFIVFVRN